MSFTIRNASLLIYISANFIGTAVAFAPPSPATKSLISSTYYRDSSTTKNFDFYRSKYSTVLSKKDENIIGESELGAERPSLFEPGGGPTVIFAPGAQDVYQQAIFRTMLWVTLAGGFGFGLWAFVDSHLGEEFFAGYLVEQSLSVDNLFVFLLLFDFFRIPLQNQDKILNWGIYGAIIMRAVMIGLGAVAIENFRPILLVFAGILVYSSAKILIEGDEDGDEDMSQNSIVQFSKKLFDSTDKFDGDKFFTLVDGVRKATPLFLCMIAIEISDVVFAVDSIPAVFGVTENPLVVFSSNMFAIMGLRSLYTILSKAATDLKYLEPSVAVVLGFIGIKMIAEFCGYHIPTEVALTVVASFLGVGIGASIIENRRNVNEQV